MIYCNKHLANEILLWWEKTVKEKHFRNAIFPWPLWKHIKFLKRNTHISIAKSKFAELRPKYVLYVIDLPQNVCTCIYYENVMLILQALYCIDSIYPFYSHDLWNKFLCFQPNDDCWFISVTNVKMHSCLAKIIVFKRIELCSKLDGISWKM